MTYIFIRHDKKKYSNGRGPKGFPRFDPPIDYKILSPHVETLKNIVPNRIFCSPFLRCRQTAERAYPDIPIETISSFCEYLGNWKNITKRDFENSTWKTLDNFVFEKSFTEFQDRIFKAYINNVLPKPEKGEVFLVVIHGICLKAWYKMIKGSSDGKITFFWIRPNKWI